MANHNGREYETIYVEVVEQPASRKLRFRYASEGDSGSLSGVNSTHTHRTYPTIAIRNWSREARVQVSCVTATQPFRPHPFKLHGRGCVNGVYDQIINQTIHQFTNLGIQCVKRDEIIKSLNERRGLGIDPYRTGLDYSDQSRVEIDLTCVRLCFSVYLNYPDTNNFTHQLAPVVSTPIYNWINQPNIHELSHCSAPVSGGQTILIFCHKIMNNDVRVRFYEEVNGAVTWEGFGTFNNLDIHKQVAIKVQTPAYRDLMVTHAVKANIQLCRDIDGASSEALPFIFTPLDTVTMRTDSFDQIIQSIFGESTSQNDSDIPESLFDQQPSNDQLTVPQAFGQSTSQGWSYPYLKSSDDGNGFQSNVLSTGLRSSSLELPIYLTKWQSTLPLVDDSSSQLPVACPDADDQQISDLQEILNDLS